MLDYILLKKFHLANFLNMMEMKYWKISKLILNIRNIFYLWSNNKLGMSKLKIIKSIFGVILISCKSDNINIIQLLYMYSWFFNHLKFYFYKKIVLYTSYDRFRILKLNWNLKIYKFNNWIFLLDIDSSFEDLSLDNSSK